MADKSSKIPFHVKDCALNAISTGERAQSLKEFHAKFSSIPTGCIFYHFWSSRLHPQFTHPEYPNDFAMWAHYGMHNDRLAEKLAVIDPTEFSDVELLRQSILHVLEKEIATDPHHGEYECATQFYFITSKTLVFSTPLIIEKPADLATTIPKLSFGNIFYHFIDARRRTPQGINDFSIWLKSFGNDYEDLIAQIHTIDPYFISLSEFRNSLTKLITNYFCHA